MRRARGFPALAALAVVLCGCASADRAARPAEPPAAPSAGARAPGAHASLVLSGPRTVDATVVVSYARADSERESLEGYLLADRPDRMRLTTHFGFFEAFQLTARGDSFWVTIPHYDAQLAGRKDEVRVTPLDPTRLAQSLFLRPGAGDTLAVDSVQADSAGSWVSGSDSLGTFRLRLDPRDLPVSLERRRPGGEPFLRVEYDRYAQVDGGRYPRRITWRDLERRQTLAMDFSDVRLDGGAPAARFEPPRKPGLRTIPWTSWEALFSAGR